MRIFVGGFADVGIEEHVFLFFAAGAEPVFVLGGGLFDEDVFEGGGGQRGCAGDNRDRVLRAGGAVSAVRQTTRFSFMTCEYQWALSLGVRFCVA